MEKASTDCPPAAVPRKRRRRAPATGATEDCFTCRKRNTKCDRRRPYCTQCIDIGKECSGYKTTLTWGIGVASRGKLRGLSLPVANSQKAVGASRDTKVATSPSKSTTSRTTSAASEVEVKQERSITSAPGSHHGFSGFGQDVSGLHATHPIPIPSASGSQCGWSTPEYFDYSDSYDNKFDNHQYRPAPLQRLHTALTPSWDEYGFSAASTGSMSTYSDSDFPSPGEYPHTPDDVSFGDPFIHAYPDTYLQPRTSVGSNDSHFAPHIPRSFPTYGDDMSSSISSEHSSHDYIDTIQAGFVGPTGMADLFMGNGMDGMGQFELRYGPQLPEPPSSEPIPIQSSASNNETMYDRTTTVFRNMSLHLPPRMEFLLDYYDRAICPVLVAFDGPANPYRKYILRMAVQSEPLQNALAALCTNNLRMREIKGVRRSSSDSNTSHASSMSDGSCPSLTADDIVNMNGEPSAEELQYKALSIDLLNIELADPRKAKDDTILATLLVLCLYHVCDSGFSKFKTQLAGVQKLLAMRNRSEKEYNGFLAWIEMFFTWFDVMTSTVNDRETEVKGDSLDMADLSANLGAMEHLSGCEGRLFKLIARLGRLNLLSQNRPVRETDPTPTATPRRAPLIRDYYGPSFDGLEGRPGSRTPVATSPPQPVTSSPSTVIRQTPQDPSRQKFWKEWHQIHRQLTTWSFPASFSPISPDIHHLSLAFQHAALLYTVRLASPHLPPSHPQFQSLVSIALGHIKHIGIGSCMLKFLLWPLFIVGAECVRHEDREVVRRACLEIMRESGFFNNLRCLEVLERVWAEDDFGGAGGDGGFVRRGTLGEAGSCAKQAFRWRKAMSRADGEYVVV
ncbi:hypothetical protein K402DRAFT_322267 [Aulographum hederae CBS 113979]|uniref:Zn(2)-C6 fungal-type domain-containing protein n=1 Tax=Aulographum hederae CBS 113979 TaxID=1176131 RepID=A0A6G1HEH0_9PEZI|nr:hypothetical protein K402DRAFT_322267 [Aulographum hederae CBS 113979]